MPKIALEPANCDTIGVVINAFQPHNQNSINFQPVPHPLPLC